MIGHVVMWRFADTCGETPKEEKLREIADMFSVLTPQIDGLSELRFGVNYNTSDAAYDAVLTTVFDTREHLAAYDAHPEHGKIRDVIRSFVLDRKVVDFEI